jgi:hypothetical protein
MRYPRYFRFTLAAARIPVFRGGIAEGRGYEIHRGRKVTLGIEFRFPCLLQDETLQSASNTREKAFVSRPSGLSAPKRSCDYVPLPETALYDFSYALVSQRFGPDLYVTFR